MHSSVGSIGCSLTLVLRTLVVAALCMAAAGCGSVVEVDPAGQCAEETYTTAQDRREIRRHVESIFEAFIAGDYQKVKQTHTADWRGFRGSTVNMDRGIDAYMAGVSPDSPNPPIGYDFIDCIVEADGDLGYVLYLARYYRRDDDGGVYTYLLRSIDLYRRDADGWNQCGSNICTLFDDPPRVPTFAELKEYVPAPKRRIHEPATLMQQADEGVRAFVEQLLDHLPRADNAGLERFQTADWQGFGVRSIHPHSRAGAGQAGTQLTSGIRFRDIVLLDLDTQVFGDTAAAFYIARATAELEPGQHQPVYLTFGDFLKREDGEWKQHATNVHMIEAVSD